MDEYLLQDSFPENLSERTFDGVGWRFMPIRILSIVKSFTNLASVQ